jgi:hypothetical protein
MTSDPIGWDKDKICIEEHEWGRQLKRPVSRCDDNIKIDFG